MKKRLAILLISTLITAASAKADYSFTEASDFTGDAFFAPPVANKVAPQKDNKNRHTTPPVKQLRLKIKNKLKQREMRNNELAPTSDTVYSGRTETSEYASKDVIPKFDDDMTPDGFEADDQSVAEAEHHKKALFHKKAKVQEPENTEDIILDCDDITYDTQNYLINANGNASVEFVKQETTVKADTIVFDRMNNTIKAEGNVRILKNSQTITGDYIFVDMNEENALIENPLTQTDTIEIKSKKGYVYGDKIVQEDGSIVVDQSFPINFQSATRGPQMHKMLIPKDQSLSSDMEKGIIRLKVKDLKITQKGDLEIISIKKGRLFKGKRTVLKVPRLKIYTNKNQDYVETNSWEIGSFRGMGLYLGPGFVFELPKGSVLKAMPVLNYKSGFGIGGIGRFSSGTNQTMFGYGTAANKFLIHGKQKLDDNLYLQYGMNDYMNEWFLGRRRPKYGATLVYENTYASDNFLIKDHQSIYKHRIEGGYFQDLDYDTNFEKLHGYNTGTTRFRYMGEARQNFFKYEDEENLKAIKFDIVSQLSASLYGTGDTQVIGRIGPLLHTQYKRWMQDIGYYFSAIDDNTPMPVFDAYRYGKQNLYLREYFRINRYLTVSWFSSINMTGDSPNGKTFQENSFYVSVGPDDMKFNVGYDFIRQNLYCTVEMMMDAKGTKVDYDTLEIKQDKKAKKDDKSDENKNENSFETAKQPKVLDKAVVEDIKTMEEVL